MKLEAQPSAQVCGDTLLVRMCHHDGTVCPSMWFSVCTPVSVVVGGISDTGNTCTTEAVTRNPGNKKSSEGWCTFIMHACIDCWPLSTAKRVQTGTARPLILQEIGKI
jgi:hypothetical protein